MGQILLKTRDRHKNFALVDDDLVEELSQLSWTWSGGYAAARIKVDGQVRYILMHRYIVGAAPGEIVDHINRVKLDNRRENLRLLTIQQNNWNRSKKADSRVSSNYIGVRRYKYDSPYWEASITVDGQLVSLGKYLDEEEAAYVFDQFAMQLRGEYASLNFDY